MGDGLQRPIETVSNEVSVYTWIMVCFSSRNMHFKELKKFKLTVQLMYQIHVLLFICWLFEHPGQHKQQDSTNGVSLGQQYVFPKFVN